MNYKLRDWLFARQERLMLLDTRASNAFLHRLLPQQRYWGEPFPIVFPDGSDEAVPLREGALRVPPPPAPACG